LGTKTIDKVRRVATQTKQDQEVGNREIVQSKIEIEGINPELNDHPSFFSE
jgi:hypothetical protein